MSHPPAVHLVGLDVALDVAQDVPLVRHVEKNGRIFGIYGAACFFTACVYMRAPEGGGKAENKKRAILSSLHVMGDFDIQQS